jgi:hypothetical protein
VITLRLRTEAKAFFKRLAKLGEFFLAAISLLDGLFLAAASLLGRLFLAAASLLGRLFLAAASLVSQILRYEVAKRALGVTTLQNDRRAFGRFIGKSGVQSKRTPCDLLLGGLLHLSDTLNVLLSGGAQLEHNVGHVLSI